ncbi:MAG: hypothetical protein GX033_01505 [Firmicutes bacterium]|nr:hypothetical protein [Bacillota bacterium]
MQQNHASMTLEQPQAEMRVQSPNGRLQIDNSAMRQDLGVGSQLVSARQRVAASIRKAQESIARKAQEGDRMMREPQVIGTLAKEANYRGAHVETNVGLVPRSLPKITYVGEPEPRIEVRPQAPRLQVTPNPPRVDLVPAAVEAYLKQRGSVEIEYVGPREIWA